jgi:hypothetical protein
LLRLLLLRLLLLLLLLLRLLLLRLLLLLRHAHQAVQNRVAAPVHHLQTAVCKQVAWSQLPTLAGAGA